MGYLKVERTELLELLRDKHLCDRMHRILSDKWTICRRRSSMDAPSLDEQLREYSEFVYRFCSTDFSSAHWTLA